MMKSILSSSLFLGLFIALNVTCLSGQSFHLRAEIDKIIRFDTDIDFKKTPGFIVAVIDNDSTYYMSFGSKDKKEKVEFTKDDIFEIGSVTKVFTASILRILVSEGKIKESDYVNDWLPVPYRNPRLSTLTINDLLHHQSGLPKRPLFFGKKEKVLQNPYALYQEKDLLEFYRDYLPDEKSFEYSHTNFALLEVIINSVTGKSYQDVLNELIIKPLGMNATFTDFPEKRQNYIAPGYDRALKKVTPWTYSSFKGSEAIKTSPADIISFLKANMNMSGSYLDTILNQSFHSRQFQSFNNKLSITMGWHNVNKSDYNIVMHTGMTSGHNVFVGIVRETKTAVVIFANSSFGTQDLGFQILRLINFNWKRINS